MSVKPLFPFVRRILTNSNINIMKKVLIILVSTLSFAFNARSQNIVQSVGITYNAEKTKSLYFSLSYSKLYADWFYNDDSFGNSIGFRLTNEDGVSCVIKAGFYCEAIYDDFYVNKIVDHREYSFNLGMIFQKEIRKVVVSAGGGVKEGVVASLGYRIL